MAKEKTVVVESEAVEVNSVAIADEVATNMMASELSIKQQMQVGNLQNEQFATFDVTTKQGKVMMYNAISGEAQHLKDNVNKKLNIVGLAMHNAESVSEDTGEVRKGIRTVFITDDSQVYATQSQSVLNGVKNLVALFGYPSKEEPWVVTPKLKKGQKQSYLILEYAG